MLKCGSCRCGWEAHRAVLRWVADTAPVAPVCIAVQHWVVLSTRAAQHKHAELMRCCCCRCVFRMDECMTASTNTCHVVCSLLLDASSSVALFLCLLCTVALCCTVVQAKDERIKELRAALGDLMESKQVRPTSTWQCLACTCFSGLVATPHKATRALGGLLARCCG
jgi:hypothetical protein